MARLTAFLVWALAAASAVFWGLRVFSPPLAVPAHAQPVATAAGSPAAVARMFARAPDAAAPVEAPPEASSRFRLLGVMAPREGREGGVALISVDGRPPRAYRSGAAVAEGFVLQQLGPRSARLAAAGGDSAFTLELPALPAAQTGTLPDANAPEGATPGAGAAVQRPATPEAISRLPGAPPAGQPAPPPPAAGQPPQPAPEEPAAEEEPSHRRPS